MRAAGLRSRARKTLPAEGLHAHDGADLVAVHIHVADLDARGDEVCRRVDAAVQTKSEAIASGVYRLANLGKAVASKSHHVKDWTEHFAFEHGDRRNLVDRRRNIGASGVCLAQGQVEKLARL